MNIFKNKNILVTGGTGMIGIYLIEKLIKYNPKKILSVSLDSSSEMHKDVEFKSIDLRNFQNCLDVTRSIDIVFHLAGVKGSPKMANEKPASFFVPTLMFNTNMMEAARQNDVKKYLYTSSVGVYSPAEIFLEEDVWKTFPSPNDIYAGWAKRMGELQALAYKKQYDWQDIYIVRPANVYGRYDNFDPTNAMVIPSLISRCVNGENPLKVLGDGSAIRDFIHASDVAEGMLKVMEKRYNEPINLGSGEEISIKNIVDEIKINFKGLEIEWVKSDNTGDKKRLMSVEKKNKIGIKNTIGIKEGIKDTVNWFKLNKDSHYKKYNSFLENK
jgi:GDP-L-fucose synthase